MFSLTLRVKYFKSSTGSRGVSAARCLRIDDLCLILKLNTDTNSPPSIPPFYMSCVTVSTARGLRIDDLCHISQVAH